MIFAASLAGLARCGLHDLTRPRRMHPLHHHGHKPLAMLGCVTILFGAHLVKIGPFGGKRARFCRPEGRPPGGLVSSGNARVRSNRRLH